MQASKLILQPLAFTTLLCLQACNNSTTTTTGENADTITAVQSDNSTTTYDNSKDALIAGAAFARKIADTLGITLAEFTLKPGDSLPLHTHRDHAIYFLEADKAVVYSPSQAKADTITDLSPGMGWISGPYTDADVNIGKKNIRWVEVSINRPRGRDTASLPGYDAATDAYTLGGESVQKIADSLDIKMFVVTMKPGDTATMHSHPDHTVYVLDGGELAVSFKGGDRVIMKMEKGMGLIGGPFSDAAKNTGKTTIRILMTHINRPRPKQ